jgi:glycerophosphoryl diester phosphodiesterase
VRVALNLVVRLLLLVLPFAAVLGLTYVLLLRRYDINFYLTDRPSAFYAAAAIGAVAVAGLAVVLVRRGAAWVLVLPIVVFEGVLPWRAFGESARRMQGRRVLASLAIAVWAAATLAASSLATHALLYLGREVAPWFGGSMAGMFSIIGVSLGVWLAVTVTISIAANAIFASILVRLYLDAGPPESLKLPRAFRDRIEVEGREWRITWPVLLGGILTIMLVLGVGSRFLMAATWADRPVLILAHRGASVDAPENTMAAFRIAGEQHADYVELDVQETADGVVVVVHDSDLMKVGRSPLKVWNSSFEALRTVDIGSFFSPGFASERLPTLAEALALCKGVSRVDIELKDYGHDQRLEERVIELVEAAGMQDQIITMSLSHKMVHRMKRLRPSWPSGLLIAKAIGNTSGLSADFLAVQSEMATRRFVREAHAAKKQVYVWTVDDPNQMIRYIGLGVDGLITNRPALARQVLDSYRALAPPERLLTFVMVRLGADESSPDMRP